MLADLEDLKNTLKGLDYLEKTNSTIELEIYRTEEALRFIQNIIKEDSRVFGLKEDSMHGSITITFKLNQWQRSFSRKCQN